MSKSEAISKLAEMGKFVKEVNVNLYLHKPLPKREYKSVEEKIETINAMNLLVQHQQVHNDVVDAGEVWIAELLANKANTGAAIPSWLSSGLMGSGADQAVIAVGTGGVATTQNDYKLTTWLDEHVATTTMDGTNKNKFVVSATFLTTEGNGSIIEAGIFARKCDSDDNGTADREPSSELDITNNRMFNRSFFGTITKSSSFELTIQWTITIGTLTA